MHLYWLFTVDHHEDWFVIEQNAKKACRFFEDAEGFSRGDASSLHIKPVPAELNLDPGWPSEQALALLGGKVGLCGLKNGGRRSVEFDGVVYIEGGLEERILQAQSIVVTEDGKPILPP